jgi:hypothetical protein
MVRSWWASGFWYLKFCAEKATTFSQDVNRTDGHAEWWKGGRWIWPSLEVLEENIGPRWSTVSENVQGPPWIWVQKNKCKLVCRLFFHTKLWLIPIPCCELLWTGPPLLSPAQSVWIPQARFGTLTLCICYVASLPCNIYYFHYESLHSHCTLIRLYFLSGNMDLGWNNRKINKVRFQDDKMPKCKLS